MSPTRRLARPLLASMFVVAGIDALRNPGPQVAKVEAAGLTDAQKLVQINGATMLGGGLMLATGRLPRLSSLALAGSLVPTTYVAHAFWNEADPAAKAQQRMHFIKNLSLLGGLLVSAADTGGRESVPHAAARLSRRARRKAAKAAADLEQRAARTAESLEQTADRFERRAVQAARSAEKLLPVG